MDLLPISRASLLAAGLTLAPQALAEQIHLGMCDASAASALDQQHFIVADDESNVLRIYRTGEAKPQGAVDLAAFLGVASDEETDIEGAAAIGQRIYWITSHGANKTGKPRPARRRLFATTIVAGTPPTVQVVASPYGKLLDEMQASPALAHYRLDAAAKLAPKEAGALSIEGLAATEQGALLIGFRNPVPQGKALIIPLTNPAEVVEGKPARFGAPVELDLGGLGIRSMERVRSHYLIVAGAAGAGKDFRLYQWSGQPQEAPQAMDAPALAGLNPEALFLNGDNQLQILSDDGTVQRDGMACKDRPKTQQAFRSITIMLK